MRSYLVSLFCLFSATLFSQNPGATVQIDIFNAPQEPVVATVDFIGSTETESYTIFLNQGLFSTFYFDPQISWNQGLVHIEDCDGDSLFDVFANSDSTDFYYTSFFYCESDSILGCVDPTAFNFNPFATIDDGSCIYNEPENDLCSGAQPLEPGTILIDNSFATQNEGIFGECWNFGSGEGEQSSLWFSFTTPANPAQISIEAIGDGTWSLMDTQFGLFTECGGEMVYCDGNSGEGLLSAFEFSCGELDTNTTYILMVDGWNGDVGTCLLEYEVTSPCSEPVFGCTNPGATNYNPEATVDDGSCQYGCSEVLIGFDFLNGAPSDSSYLSTMWTVTNEYDSTAFSGSWTSPAPQLNLCLEDGCYTFTLFNLPTQWQGIYHVVTSSQVVSSGTFTGENETFQFHFGVNQEGCDEVNDVFGCTDPAASNYNPSATIDDGSCEYFECDNNEVIVLINTENWGYEISWNIRNEAGNAVAGAGDYPDYSTITESACLEDGCYTFELFDSFGDGWNDGTFELILDGAILASGTLEDGEFGSVPFGVNTEGCQEVVLGCTDPEALNYNPDATEDDGSCEYFECENNEVMVVVFTENWGYEISWNIRNEEGDEVAGSGVYPNYSTITEWTCLEDGCYSFELFDSFGDGWNGGSFQVILNNNILASGTLADGEFGSVPFGVNAEGCDDPQEVFGCTDPEALNYNPEATIDDGSCNYDFECGISFEVIADSSGGNMFYIIPSDNIVNASSVLWDFGDGATSSEFYPTHIYESDGPFTLCLFVSFEDDNGNFCEISYCEILDGALFGSGFLSGGFMINVIESGTLSDNLSLAEKELSVYPNPTNDITTVSFRSDQSDKLTLRVTDLTGKVIEQKILSSSVGQQKIQVDLSEFPQGLYLIGLEQSNSTSYAKVVRR